MRRSTWTGSNRPSGITSLTPASRPTTRLEWQPDTWNSGDVSSDTVGAPLDASADPASGLAMAPAMVENSVFCRLAIIDRCVDMAPLGFPVVPDV